MSRPRAASRRRAPVVHRWEVECFDDAGGDFVHMGQVILPPEAFPHEVEHALMVLGLYCPQGADKLEWIDEVGLIFEAPNDKLIVRMWRLT